MKLEIDVAPGVHRVEDANTNWYLIEDEGRLTVVDAGVPRSWGSLLDAVRRIDRDPGDIEALILTHAHFDHIGFAERARRELEIPVMVHTNDVPIARRPRQYTSERPVTRYLLTKPAALPIVAGFVATAAFFPRPVRHLHRFTEGVLEVPGRPRIVPTPGHTIGHVAFHLPDRDVVIAGDAVVTLNPYTGGRGPQLVAGAATADIERALSSLDAIAATGAGTVLPGHGEPWTEGAEAIAAAAREAGPT